MRQPTQATQAQTDVCHAVQAIDLIDEAGSRVRLQHAQLPEEARELDKELRALTKEKSDAVRGQDFEKAGQVCLPSQLALLCKRDAEFVLCKALCCLMALLDSKTLPTGGLPALHLCSVGAWQAGKWNPKQP